MRTTYDVLVVGAGPAGSSAAYHLARQGVNVLLLDKCDFPREKTCGDALNQRCLSLLSEMDLLDEVVRMGHRCGAVKLTAPAGHSATIPLSQRADGISYGLIIPRLILDDLLLQHALAYGAQFHSPVRVTDVLFHGNWVEVRGDYQRRPISYRAHMVILAIGANTGLLVRMGLLKKRPRFAVATRAYFEGITDVTDQARFYLESVSPPGYGWILPLSDASANIGAALLSSRWQNHQIFGTSRNAFDAFLQTPQLERILAGAHQSSPVKGFPVRTDFATAPTFGERVMLVGEAAGLGHPLTGEGIAYALESGKLAAEHLCRILSTGDVSRKSLQRYDWQLRLRYQLFFTLHNVAPSIPFLSYPLVFTHSMNCFVQLARLAFHIPIARGLAFYALGAVPNAYSLSMTPLLKRRERRSEPQEEVVQGSIVIE